MANVYSENNLPVDGWQEFRKKTPTRMLRIDGPFIVDTGVGRVTCDDGYLAVDARGNPYPVSTAVHELIYEPVRARKTAP